MSEPEELPSAYREMGGRDKVVALAERFYAIMAAREPALARLHKTDERGEVDPEVRGRFALFLVGWLGGPQDYIAQHGHPRLRMRHARVPVDKAMRDAWLRCMLAAMEECGVPEATRRFLAPRFAQVADFLRNVPEEP